MILATNKDLSIDEGIEKLKSLSISEKIKNNNHLNIEKSSEQKAPLFIKNNTIKNKNQKYIQNFNSNDKTYSIINTYKRKRNYNTFLNESKKRLISINYYNTNKNDKKVENVNLNNISQNNKLLAAEILEQKLLKTKSQAELENILFSQLFLLEEKKMEDINLEQIKKRINILNEDKIDLIKCLKYVNSALNKKRIIETQINEKIEALEEEIAKISRSINYNQILGDCYLKEIKRLKLI